MLFWLKKQAAQYTESHLLYKLSVIDLYTTADNILNDL